MIGLVVVGNGRTAMLDQTVEAAFQWLPPFDRYLMVDDSGDLAVRRHLDSMYPDFVIEHHDQNRGMAAAVRTGFDLAVDTGCRYVFWLEEDMLLTSAPPVADAVDVLDARDWLSQLCFRREPVPGNVAEHEHGDQLAAICAQARTVSAHDGWTAHDWLFSLNPCLIPRRILEQGWDTANEAGMTARLLNDGYLFGSWGQPGDGQTWARHIGTERGAAWQL
jgi:hypothetical protein